ncbi:hypothetical protein N0V93_004428 [Gnomoniopsis smithogilvyi]|uniref:Mitochondrial outer membrane protein OM14 C-terminal domain-containing protein n=1 Tax=Gnomoniopsis smithogilvyi TaxID=1191159 RepID=A0A9W9CX46_9PEZI|nr:hypothetical protein N0V93_004428 [Gnomoniopsis smithogilvyi]
MTEFPFNFPNAAESWHPQQRARRASFPIRLHPNLVEGLQAYTLQAQANHASNLQAAAPPVPEIEPNESQTTSTGSLIDVDTQSVRTVPSDFMEQSIQTDTQAERIEREDELKDLADKAKAKKEKAKKKAVEADNWLLSKIAALSDNQASGIVYANLAAVVGLSAVLGYKAWGLHERGALRWSHAGVGAAVVGAVGIVEGVFSRFFTKARGSSSKA